MSGVLTHILIVAAYGAASGAGGVIVAQLFGVGGAIPWLVGGGGFLVGAQIHALVARMFDRGAVESEFADMRRTNIILSEELEDARSRMGELSEALNRETHERKRANNLERQVLEELVERTIAAVQDANASALKERGQQSRIAGDAEPSAAPRAPSILQTVRDAVEQNRVDVYLQPIVSLPQRKLRFYEAFSRLRDRFGEELPAAEYIPEAEKAGLISSIDSLLTFRCVQILRKLTARDKSTAIFCNISPYSLRDLTFFPQFLDYLARNRDLRNHLIFELPQTCLENAMETEERHIARLVELGFRLSVDRVTSLQLDLMKLKDKNVRYVKVAGDMLISALRAPEAHLRDNADLSQSLDIHAEDFKEVLTRYGVDLIAEKLESEAQVVEVLDLQVDYGQGYLFGAPTIAREHGLEAVEQPKDDAPARLAGPQKRGGLDLLIGGR